MTPTLTLGTVPPASLGRERVHLHAAAHMTAWVGRRLLPAGDGPIRAALFWDGRGGGRLEGAPIDRGASRRPIRVALAFDPPAIVLLEGDDRAVGAHLPLDGTTRGEAWAWLAKTLEEADVETKGLIPPSDDALPGDHLRDSGAFRIDQAPAAELGRWFATAAGLLTEQAVSRGLSPDPPCWSHHFDMALVVPLKGPDQPQVTLGFSPGDDTIPEPYFYILAWPLAADLEPLPDAPRPGRWQREGWTGLALPGSILLATQPAADPIPVARSFLERGFDVASSVALTG